jgi:surface-anchored protein
VAVVGIGLVVPSPSPANAAPRQVISGVHADLVTASVADGGLYLGSSADIDGTVGQVVDPYSTIFNVESAAAVTLGQATNASFLGDAGTTVWIAPQTNPGPGILWPGVSAEAVETGAVDGDAVALELIAVDGPGFVSVYQEDGLGGSVRRFDSRDDAYRTWQLFAGQHAHANWAFSATGRYTLTIGATVSIAGTEQQAIQEYVVVVGDVAPPRATSITPPAAQALSVEAGSALTLRSTIAPADAVGSVQFFDNTGNVGWAAVEDGVAEVTSEDLSLGAHSISARFEPDSEDDFVSSVSAPVTVTVTSPWAEGSIQVSGMPKSITNGSRLVLTVESSALPAGNSYQWVMRGVGESKWETIYDDDTYLAETGSTLTRDITTHYNGYEVAVQIVRDNLVLGQSEAAAFTVVGPSVGTGLDVSVTGVEESFDYGTYADLAVAGVALPQGARYQWVYFYPRSTAPYVETDLGDPSSTTHKTVYPVEAGYLDFAVRILANDGAVLGTSPLYTLRTGNAPILAIEGVKTFYAPGDTVSARAVVSPSDTPFTTYRWSLFNPSTRETTAIEGATGPTVSFAAGAELNKGSLSVSFVDPRFGTRLIGNATEELIVVDPAAGDVLYFNPLARHYHSGDAVKLHLVSTSSVDTDSYRWFIKRTDQSDFQLLPTDGGVDHTLTAEVALASAQVKAERVNAAGEVVATSDTTTIAVDDHGNPPSRFLEVEGPTTLSAGVPAHFVATSTPASILDRVEWWIQKSTEGAPSRFAVTIGRSLTITPDESYDGATVVARLTKDTAETYAEAPPVTLSVAAGSIADPGATPPGAPALPGFPALGADQQIPPAPVSPTSGTTQSAADGLAATGLSTTRSVAAALGFIVLGALLFTRRPGRLRMSRPEARPAHD